MLYTSFRIKRETYQKLRELRDELDYDSIDQVIALLLASKAAIKLDDIIKYSNP